jgi:hypothetical protein
MLMPAFEYVQLSKACFSISALSSVSRLYLSNRRAKAKYLHIALFKHKYFIWRRIESEVKTDVAIRTISNNLLENHSPRASSWGASQVSGIWQWE